MRKNPLSSRAGPLVGPDADVRAFGAVGDGETRDTAAMQRAIDACAAAGGGRVTVPAGVFITGTLYLKDRVTLHLGDGAVLRGSPDLADYNRDDAYPQNRVFASERVTGAHLIVALEAEDVAIDGPGVIDGNSAAFYGPPDRPGGKFTLPGKRPGQMICFVECRRVRVADTRLENAPYWTLFLHGCETVTVRGVRIANPFATLNGDGIDVDTCRDVAISDCIIRSGDDSITLRANPAPLKNPDRVCENITVANCVLATPCNAIRVGVGDGAIRHAVFSNCVISDTRNGICLIGNYSGMSHKGADIEDVRFSNFSMKTVMPFFLFTGTPASARIRDIAFSGIRATGSKASVVRGIPGCRVSDIRFTDIDLEIAGGAGMIGADADLARMYWEWDRGRPCALQVACADRVTLDRVSLRWGACDGPWRHALLAEAANGLALRNCDLPPPPGAAAAEAVRESPQPPSLVPR